MFSRSDKSDEPTDELYETEEKQRSPMILAALAGLLAIAGAFLLVRYLSDQNDEAAAEAAATQAEASREVLVVTAPIPAGTDVSEILAAPTSYLAARAVPEQFVAGSAITSIEELRELDGLTLSSDALAGEQLLRGRFVDRSDFSGDGLLERRAQIDVPEGHHTVVLPIQTSAALGGNFTGGEKVSVIGNFRITPPEGETFQVSVMMLPSVEVIEVQSTAEFTGQLSNDIDALGTAAAGELYVTLALEPDEITDLTYAMAYSSNITLAGALPEGTEDDPKWLSTIDTIMEGAVFASDVELEELLGLATSDDDEDDEEIEGLDEGDGEADAGDDAPIDPAADSDFQDEPTGEED